MRHLGMLDGSAAESDHPVILDPVEILPSPATGILYPLAERGQSVAKDALLARITDYFGNPKAEIRAPFAGEVLYIIGTPPVSQGHPAVFLGVVKH
jgi:predicted deacylase